MTRILVTGAAGFIGFHLGRLLLESGHDVVGFDGLTPYYDTALKHERLAQLQRFGTFRFVEGMLEDAALLRRTVSEARPEIVVHLAAQAGVRYSLEAPQSYIQSNVVGTANLLEALRAHPVRHLLFASTSSVYGGNTKLPFVETDLADHPVSLYAATKKSGEAMVHSYAHLFGIASTAVRFFTVYGPYGRPDMAAIKFADAMLSGRSIDVYGYGRMRRDFTYVDDLVASISALLDVVPVQGQGVAGDSLSAVAPYRVVNIGGGAPSELMDFIAALEEALGVKAELNLLPMQPGDVVATFADTSLLNTLVPGLSHTPMREGVRRFADWYKPRHGMAAGSLSTR
ncbi:NAD-dependent epimerase/dehydratase family protein [Devosia sp. 63-57]|uniref:NAD-dependent epimerase/dehydratase family protein n=1 Tax=Devosia sp. 63-57 TaxID=1895751 RepID=UPI00086D0353|nr:NAD-dependent epimerase/dehydratase family protein [Devosia sp. 63-57]ODT49817.1 MAG: UDP-glucuronate 5-epimerase [Pelagibacterium sp. SCN 63-126]ODU86249.1 MAG: UDP-glucuronate 5-epimerase [Pelagibacterium sp. SCN 63-17]OJX45192.1 MAG: UDP-glucuronate 5-epimerase [Devosia sp. 63-57]